MFTKETRYLFLIITIFISACIETDIYLPAFTDMMSYFSISEEEIQSLLTWNFIGVCISGPFYGPLSDAMGRKKPLLIALGMFLTGSIATIFADNFNFMLFGRVLQGLGSGGCFTLGTAIVFDAFQEKKAIEAISKINSICPFIMAGAPMVGGYLNQTFGFRSNFLAIGIFVIISFTICLLFFEETLSKAKRAPLEMGKILKDFKRVALSLSFWQTTLIVSLPFAGYLAFLATMSVLFIIEFGVRKEMLPYFQGAILGAWLIASLASKRSIARWGIPRIKKIATVFIMLGGIGLIGSAWKFPEDPYLLTLAMMVFTFGANWSQGLYFPEGMEIFPEIRGVAASFLTSARLLIAAWVVGISSLFYDRTIYPVVAINCGLIIIVILLIIFYEKKKQKDSSLLSEVN